ncbi:hypothetical protein BH09VER1_BH09VER1_34430 [soil metagenome]
MKDERIQNSLAKMMVAGTLLAAAIMAVGLVWFLYANPGIKSTDHLFTGEPKYYESPISMVTRAMDFTEVGHRRSVIMIGVLLLLLNPVARVGLAAVGFARQNDRMYMTISLIVLAVLLFSFFW